MDKDLEGNCTKSCKIEANARSMSSMDSLPREMVLNILSRLPVTSLVNAKFVCQSWKNIVCDHLLVLSHFSQMSKKNPSLILHCSFPVRSQLYFVQNFGHIADTVTAKRIILPNMPDFIVAGSCNGLLCLYNMFHSNEFYVFNPFTRNYLELPKAEKLSKHEAVSFGFGCLPTSKEYKVVRIVYYRLEDDYPRGRFSTLRSNVQVLNLGSSSWRTIGEISYQLQRQPSHTLVNGRLHWLTLRYAQQPLRMLVSFDLADEQFRIVPEPDGILLRRRRSHLVILGGCLSLATYGAKFQLDIWIMREYDVKESWTKSFSIGSFYLPKKLSQNEVQSSNILERCSNPTYARVLCILENGEVLLNFKGRALILYEPKSGCFKQLKFTELPNVFEPVVHIGSLNWIDNITDM